MAPPQAVRSTPAMKRAARTRLASRPRRHKKPANAFRHLRALCRSEWWRWRELAPPQAVRSTPAMERAARARGSIPAGTKKPREPKKVRAALAVQVVEVAGIEPACPWPSHEASTLIVPF